MFLRIAREIAKPQHFAILDLLKRSTGMPVNELSSALKLSYMGVKQHCIELEKKGFLDTWRRRIDVGRPEMVYRLTAKALSLYPDAGNEMTLEILQSIQQIYGPSAPDKLLFNYFMRKAARYQQRLGAGSLLERATDFARLRNREGYCAGVECSAKEGFRIAEYHCPHQEIAAEFPSVRQLETQMFSRVLMTDIERKEESASGLTKTSWVVPALAHAASPARAEKASKVRETASLLTLAS